MKNAKKEAKNKSALSVTLNVIGVILIIVLVPVLVLNLTLIIKSYTNKDDVPSFGDYLPMIVLTDSMKGDKEDSFDGGSLVIDKKVDPTTLKVGDVISFYDPLSKGNSKSVVTHRIIEVTTDKEGELAFITQGDANNTADEDPIPAKNVIGIYVTHINHAGSVAMFMSTTTGLIVCVVVPLVLLIGYDVLRRKLYDKKQKASQPDTDALMAELEALKAEKAQAEEAKKEE